jgi:hypothetical protein
MASFLQTLLHPDREEDPEKAQIAKAANLLQVGEFQVLQLAHFEWFGEEMSARTSDDIFRTYMLRGEVPGWARHYARRIIVKAELGDLEDHDPAYHRYDCDYYKALPLGARRLMWAVCCLTFVMAAILSVGLIAPVPVTSILPPYFTEKELAPAPVGDAHKSNDLSGS